MNTSTQERMKTASQCSLCRSEEVVTIQKKVRDWEYGAPGDYEWQKCKGCTLIRLHPLPTGEALRLAFPADYHAYVSGGRGLARLIEKRRESRIARDLSRRVPVKGSILHLGCGTGQMLAEVEKYGSFGLYGVERTRSAVADAKRRGVEVWEGDFEQANVPAGSMDLVFVEDVLGQVVDPVSTLERVYRVLKSLGTLVGYLPNIRSFDARLFGAQWGGGHVPRHLFQFTPETLKKTLEHCGFTDITIHHTLDTSLWALSIQNLLRRRRKNLDDIRKGRAWYYTPLLLLTFPFSIIQWLFGRTSAMRFEATKGE